MQHYVISPTSGGLFLFSDFQETSTKNLLSSSALYKIIYNRGTAVNVYLDNSRKRLNKNEVLFCKPLQSVEVLSPHPDVQVIAFNKDFYSLQNQDEEREFYGFWFLGFNHSLIISLNDIEQNFFNITFSCIEQEFIYNRAAETQREVLKRIISTTNMRLLPPNRSILLGNKELDIFKRFSNLIEAHFKKRTDFEDIVKTISKKPSFLQQIADKYFFKIKKSEEEMATNRANEYHSKSPLETRAIENSLTVFVNSKLNTKSVMPLFPKNETPLNI